MKAKVTIIRLVVTTCTTGSPFFALTLAQKLNARRTGNTIYKCVEVLEVLDSKSYGLIARYVRSIE